RSVEPDRRHAGARSVEREDGRGDEAQHGLGLRRRRQPAFLQGQHPHAVRRREEDARRGARRAESVTKVGISPRLFHPEPGARGVHTKLLDYLEHSVGEWIGSRGALAFLLPLADRAADYAQALDGLVLQGGADISPRGYGEEPQKPEWAGDEMRDRYEMALVRAFTSARKPVLGI